MKLDRSSKLTIGYCLFTLLYTFYITGHHGPHKGDAVFYQIKFLLVDGYLFFIIQGLILRSKNWGIICLLPLGILVATVIAAFLVVWILRWGGGTLLNHDNADMILVVIIWLVLCCYSLKLIAR